MMKKEKESQLTHNLVLQVQLQVDELTPTQIEIRKVLGCVLRSTSVRISFWCSQLHEQLACNNMEKNDKGENENDTIKQREITT